MPTTAAPALSANVTCKDTVGGTTGTIFYPGRYTSPPVANFNGNARYYFASGVYYFQNAGTINLRGSIFGGQPASPETQKILPSVATPCADDAMANALRPGSASGSGVTFILGGNSAIDIRSTAAEKMEFFTRVGGPGPDGIFLYADTSADPTPPANYTANTAPVVLDTHGTGNTVVIHGLVYIPRHDVNIWAINNAQASNTPQLAGGLVCRTLIISVNNGSGTGSVAGLGSPVTVTTARTVVITATASGTTQKAVVVVGVDANKTTTILSWRTVE